MPALPESRRVSRRATVGAALALPVVAAGCDIDPPRRRGEGPGVVRLTPDGELVVATAADLALARAVIEGATLAVPALAVTLTPLSQAHAAHSDVLSGVVATPGAETSPGSAGTTAPDPVLDPPRLPADRDRALRRVLRSEQQLVRDVLRRCGQAESGDLARVLASLAASTSQHSAALSAPATAAVGGAG